MAALSVEEDDTGERDDEPNDTGEDEDGMAVDGSADTDTSEERATLVTLLIADSEDEVSGEADDRYEDEKDAKMDDAADTVDEDEVGDPGGRGAEVADVLSAYGQPAEPAKHICGAVVFSMCRTT